MYICRHQRVLGSSFHTASCFVLDAAVLRRFFTPMGASPNIPRGTFLLLPGTPDIRGVPMLPTSVRYFAPTKVSYLAIAFTTPLCVRSAQVQTEFESD